MKKINYLILLFLFLITTNSYAQNVKYTSYEKEEIKLFNDFKNYITSCIRNKYDITDSVRLNYILSNYVFINAKVDSSRLAQSILHNLTPQQLNSLKETVNTFYRFLQERENKKLSENLVAIPTRVSTDKCIYDRLTAFQKNNTLIFFDKREPTKILGDILFIPAIKNVTSSSKIWSWTLVFKFGKFMFKSITGEEGYEYMFSPEEFK